MTGHEAIPAGAKFGRIAVLREAGRSNAGKRIYECRCDCGETKKIIGADLKSGRTTSCGCARAEKSSAARQQEAEDITGHEFAGGLIKVIGRGELVDRKRSERRGGHRVREWICECNCGKQFRTLAAALRKGQVTSCGCRKIALTRERMKANATKYDFFGERLTLAEIEEVTSTEGPTIAYRMRKLGISAEQAATTAPLRRLSARPKGRHAAARKAA